MYLSALMEERSTSALLYSRECKEMFTPTRAAQKMDINIAIFVTFYKAKYSCTLCCIENRFCLDNSKLIYVAPPSWNGYRLLNATIVILSASSVGFLIFIIQQKRLHYSLRYTVNKCIRTRCFVQSCHKKQRIYVWGVPGGMSLRLTIIYSNRRHKVVRSRYK